MERLTTDKPDGNLQAALNMFYAKDGEAWVRGGGPGPEYPDVTLNDYIRRAIKQVATCPPMFDELDDQKLAEVMADWCMDEIESQEGIIGTLYAAGWVCAELRARLKMYEDTGLTPEQVAARKPLAEFLHPVDAYKGLKAKFLVFKAESGEKVDNCFVIRPEKDAAAVEALRAYANSTDNKTLSNDIYNWVGEGNPAQKWFPVVERLPEADKKVLVITANGSFKVARCNFYKNGTEVDWATNDGLGEKTITHWMPLPHPPKEVNQ